MLIDIHTHKDILEDDIFSIKNISINQRINEIDNFSVGVHPWEEDFNDENFKKISLLAKKNNVLMIGETGLDKLKGNLSIQKEYFLKHIELSENLKKPIIIHCVKAFDEILEIKNEISPKQKWIIHGFSKGKDLAQKLVENDFYLSFGESLFKSEKNIKAFIEIEKSRFFLETDNKTLLIEDVYLRASRLKKIKLKEIEEIIEINFKNIK